MIHTPSCKNKTAYKGLLIQKLQKEVSSRTTMYAAVLPFLFLITSLFLRSFIKQWSPDMKKRILAKSYTTMYAPVAGFFLLSVF